MNNFVFLLSHYPLGHAFGARYELPIPLVLFVLGGGAVVLLSFLLVVRQKVAPASAAEYPDTTHVRGIQGFWAALSLLVLTACITVGIAGSQEAAENIVPTLFWLIIWIAVPLSAGIVGDWTQVVNPFAIVAKLTDNRALRKRALLREASLAWPVRVGWWPAVAVFFILACGELIYNQTVTRPVVIGAGLLIYFVLSAFAGLVYGKQWLECGEVFTVLFATWGRLGFFRFGAPGRRGFAGGLQVPFEASVSRVTFVLLLLVSVGFDGLLSTPLWSRMQHHLPNGLAVGTTAYLLLATLIFAALAFVFWAVFSLLALAVSKVGVHKLGATPALAGLLPSLVPISFGYLLAHNLEYLVLNGQLLFPLIGNPVGKESWPIHLPHPFNDSFEPNRHLLPSSFYWYASVIVIVIVHIVAVVLAHRYLGRATKNEEQARRSEYPWIVAMVAYTMFSLWLLAQPLVKEKADETGIAPTRQTVAVAQTNAVITVDY